VGRVLRRWTRCGIMRRNCFLRNANDQSALSRIAESKTARAARGEMPAVEKCLGTEIVKKVKAAQADGKTGGDSSRVSRTINAVASGERCRRRRGGRAK